MRHVLLEPDVRPGWLRRRCGIPWIILSRRRRTLMIDGRTSGRNIEWSLKLHVEMPSRREPPWSRSNEGISCAPGATFAAAAWAGRTGDLLGERVIQESLEKGVHARRTEQGLSLATFQLLKEAGFEGVELISPNELDLDEVLTRATRPD